MATTSQASALTNLTNSLVGVELPCATLNTKPGTYTTLIPSLSATTRALMILFGRGEPVRTSYLVDIAIGGVGSEVPLLENVLVCNGNDYLHSVILLPKGASSGARISARAQSNDNTGSAPGPGVRAHVIAIQGEFNHPGIESITTYGANLTDSGGVEIPIPTSSNVMGPWSADITGGGLTEDCDGFYVAIGNQGVAAMQTTRMLMNIGTGVTPTVVVPGLQFGSDSAERYEPQILPYFPVALSAGTQVKAQFQAGVLALLTPLDICIYPVRFAPGITAATANETDSAHATALRKAIPSAIASESDTAVAPPSVERQITAATATETDAAVALPPVERQITASTATETDAALSSVVHQDGAGNVDGGNGSAVVDYLTTLRQLLPRGPIWEARDGSRMAQLLSAIASLLSDVHARAFSLISELDPRLANEMVTDWERVLNIPGECGTLAATLQGRRDAILEKLTDPGGQTIARMLEIAERFGHPNATIEEHHYTRIGDEIGDAISGPEWTFAFTLRTVEDLAITEARIGSRIGEPLRAWGNDLLECAIEHAKPAHTTAAFAYGSI